MSDDAVLPKNNVREILDQIPPELLSEALERRQDVVIGAHSRFSGPIPPPSLLEHYETIHQGFADRIVSMAEVEQSHRHSIEESALKGSILAEKRGQIFAFLTCGVLLLGSIGLILQGHDVSGTFLVSGTLAGLAYVFITGRRGEETNKKDDP